MRTWAGMMATREGTRIVKPPDLLGGNPRVAGRRIGVLYLYEQVEGAGKHPADVAAGPGDLAREE